MAKKNSKGIPLIASLIGLTILVTIHEFGHYIMCKIFDIRTPVFSIGFGPRLLGVNIGETLFQIAALPLGGYVSMNEHDLALAPYYQKMIIVIAGVGFNLIFASLLLFWLFYSQKSTPIPVIASIVPDSPADIANLQAGDRITKIGNTLIKENANIFLKEIYTNPDEIIDLIVSRDEMEIKIPIKLGSRLGGNAGFLGVSLETQHIKRQSLLKALKKAISDTYAIFIQTARLFFQMFRTQEARKKISGPIGLISTMAEGTTEGMRMYAFLLSSISIQLAFFNILPIPLLDGGKLVQYTIELIFGNLAPLIMGIMNLIIFFLAIAFFVSLIFRDIRRIKQDKTK